MSKQKKPREQISGIVGGHIVPATETPLLTSASTPWSGFLLEKHNTGDRQDVSWGLASGTYQSYHQRPAQLQRPHFPWQSGFREAGWERLRVPERL
jgi:hypothetical protein